MKTAVMQPYIFPYIGYYQLIWSADTFVILDDVNFIMRGWINRNNILLNGKPHLFTIPLQGASQNKLIADTKLNFSDKEKQNFLKTVQQAYKKAPFFKDFYPVLENVFHFDGDDLTDFLHRSFALTLAYLGVEKNILRSSQIEKDASLRAEERIIAICKTLHTDMYINPCGGKALYNKERFALENMHLRFINTLFDEISYRQFNNEFVPNLSMIDVLMFNSTETVLEFLNKYTLVEGEKKDV